MNILWDFHFFFEFVVVFRFRSFAYKNSQQPFHVDVVFGIYHSHVSSLWMNYQIICEKVSLWLIQIDTFRNFKILFELFQWIPFTDWSLKFLWTKASCWSPEWVTEWIFFPLHLLFISQGIGKLWMCQMRMKFNQICFLFNQNVFCF